MTVGVEDRECLREEIFTGTWKLQTLRIRRSAGLLKAITWSAAANVQSRHTSVGRKELRTMESVNGVEATISARDVGEQVTQSIERCLAHVQLALQCHAAETLLL